jgi:hypothetical protein
MSDRISDTRLLQILQTRACPGLPGDLCDGAYRAARRLLAARDWGDILAPVAKLTKGHFAIHAHGKWVIVFIWIPGQGARELALQRV